MKRNYVGGNHQAEGRSLLDKVKELIEAGNVRRVVSSKTR